MNVEILIVSYSKDIPYLRYNLKSINKFCRGFSGVTVSAPNQERAEFLALRMESPVPFRMKFYERIADESKWQMHAQVQKCLADLLCNDADFILHTDSDCIFTENVVPEDYFVDGKPVMLMQKYTSLPGMPWKPIVERALKMPVDYEFMRRHPQVNPIGVYSMMRNYMHVKHGVEFEQWVLQQQGGFPFGFSEHNTIGAYAYKSMHPAYHWVDLDKDAKPKDKLAQFWSKSPPEVLQNDPNGGRCVPLEVINRVLQ